ncbi:hypothetical protein CAEBREN_22113 [Caenorhabditis brenneri]|uniref:Uncharacterized protein n=1 Tax=Caenorhabditis brenneri TaxID=135651 RepID=G0NM06_CAEBE|nr:hypothetical protein CAEBREN_22113 [Caenorhabditis brenneri]
MDNRPVSYVALKSVFKHIEANKRFQISAACPSLRKVEKTVPLTINFLSFVTPYEIQINDKIYYFGVIRDYQEGIPPCIEKRNITGGMNCDVDEWGFDITSSALSITPGDIIIGEQLDEYEEVNDDEKKRQIEDSIERYKIKKNEDADEYNKARYDWIIGLLEASLLPYQNRENNIRRTHECYIQLSFKSDQQEETVKIGRVPYNRKLFEAVKCFMNIIFGGRHSVVNVESMKVDCPNQIIRLPEGIKFNIRHLEHLIDVERSLNALLPVLDESCLPIKRITTYRINAPEENSSIRKAEEVTCRRISGMEPIDFIQSLPCLKVNYFYDEQYNDGGEALNFIKYLLEKDKRVGTTYQFGILKNIMEIFDMIEEQLKDNVTINLDDQLLIIPMNGSKQLQISYRKNIENVFFDFDEPAFILKIEIVGKQDTE